MMSKNANKKIGENVRKKDCSKNKFNLLQCASIRMCSANVQLPLKTKIKIH